MMVLYSFMLAILLQSTCRTTADSTLVDSCKTIELSEVVVVQKTVQHKAGKDVYVITPQFQEKAFSTMDLLKRLPGVTVDNLSQKIAVRMDNRVLLLVDGKQQPSEFMRTLNSEQVAKVEIAHVIPEKYRIAGYKYIINIVLRKKTGHNLSLQNFMMYSPGNNGEDNLANEQPKLNYSYSGDKLKVSAGYGYANIHWNYPLAFSKAYLGGQRIETRDVSPQHPSDFNFSRTNNVFLGIDYALRKGHTLYLRSSFLHSNDNHSNTFSFYDGLSVSNEMFGNSNSYNNYKAQVGYEGQWGTRLSYNTSISLDRQVGNVTAYYTDNNSRSTRYYKNWKTFAQGDLDLTYNVNDVLALNFGYSFLWNSYHNGINASNLITKNTFRRNNTYLYADWMLTQQLSLHAGIVAELFSTASMGRNSFYKELLPNIQLLYMPSEVVRVVGEFSSQMVCPNQSQLSGAAYQIDEKMWAVGNTGLRPSRKNSLSLQAVLWDNLTLGVVRETHQQYITPFYSSDTNGYYKSLVNAKLSSWNFLAMYDWQLAKNFTLASGITIASSKISNGELSNRQTNAVVNCKLSWFSKRWGLNAEVEYAKEMVRNALLQGWEEAGQDLWLLSLQKTLMHRQLNISLNYIPPLRWFVEQYQQSNVDAGFYKETQRLNLQTYDNLLMLRISFNLNSGKRKRMKNVNAPYINEERKGRGLL